MKPLSIALTKGLTALVDAADFEELSKHRWSAKKDHNTWYAARYVYVGKYKGTTITMHQQLLGAKGVDHRDGNGLNNQRANLRLASAQQNAHNSRKCARKTSSKYKGVWWRSSRRKWAATITIPNSNGVPARRKTLGHFLNEEKAALAYDQAAVALFGEFAKLNFPEEARGDHS